MTGVILLVLLGVASYSCRCTPDRPALPGCNGKGVGLGQLDEAVGRGCGLGEVEQVITVDGVRHAR